MTTYPHRQGIDYGPRRGTLGLAFHMAEGGDGTLGYLAKRATETHAQWRTRVRGVSANAVILTDGTVWNMVDWDNASGSMNPNDRNPSTTGYYNGTVIKAVLGDKYVDPNAYSISVEICGFRAQGPSDAQVRGAIAWGLDMRARYPSLRGAYGHHDQTDTKGCPGTTPNMKAIFAGVGGHGLFPEEETVKSFSVRPVGTSLMMLRNGAVIYDNSDFLPSTGNVTVSPAREMPLVGYDGDGWRAVQYIATDGQPSGKSMFVKKADITGERTAPVSASLPVQVPPDAVACKPFTDALTARIANANSRIQRAATDLGATPPAPI